MVWASETIFSVYGLFCHHVFRDLSLREIRFPLYTFTPVTSGGLGLSEAAIGIQMALRAFVHIAIMPFYSKLEHRFGGTVRFYRITMWAWPVVVVYMPFLNLLARLYGSYSWPVNVSLVIFYFLWGLCCYAWSKSSKTASLVNEYKVLTLDTRALLYSWYIHYGYKRFAIRECTLNHQRKR